MEIAREGERYAEPVQLSRLVDFGFYLWGAMGQVAQAQKPKNSADPETAVCTAWSQIDMEVVRKAIRDSWPKRPRQRVVANGGKFEQSL